MYELPTYVEVNERKFNIRKKGDYRVILDCFSALNDEELSETERVLASLLIFYNEFEELKDLPNDQSVLEELITKMFDFMKCGEKESVGIQSDYTVLDWEQDETIVTSAINKVAGTEIRMMEYMHWYTFMGYFMAVGESVLSTVVSIRSKIAKHEKLEKWEDKFRKDNPSYFIWRNADLRALEGQAKIDEIWNRGE